MATDFSQWDNSQIPEDEDINFEWKILRCNGKEPLSFACISAGYYGCYAHYEGRRTYPHLLTDCSYCKKGNLKRWGGYVLGLQRVTRQKIIAHFPMKTCKQILNLQKEKQTLRGLAMCFYRMNGLDQGPVGVRLLKLDVREAELPLPEPIRPLLAKIWGFNDQATFEEHTITNDNVTLHEHDLMKGARIVVPRGSMPLDENGETVLYARVLAQHFADQVEDGVNGASHNSTSQ